jgi:hypothetical protein
VESDAVHLVTRLPSIRSWLSRTNRFVFINIVAFEKAHPLFSITWWLRFRKNDSLHCPGCTDTACRIHLVRSLVDTTREYGKPYPHNQGGGGSKLRPRRLAPAGRAPSSPLFPSPPSGRGGGAPESHLTRVTGFDTFSKNGLRKLPISCHFLPASWLIMFGRRPDLTRKKGLKTGLISNNSFVYHTGSALGPGKR